VIYDRSGLAPGQVVEGPAIIEQPDTTTIVPNSWRAQILANGILSVKPTA
jgi:N-methylhydantoinase A